MSAVSRLHIYDLVRGGVTCFYTTPKGKKQAIKGMRKVKMPIKYVNAAGGDRALLEKSVTEIKGAKTNSKGVKNVLLMTEDAHLISPPIFADPPKDYDILYFGGAIQDSVTHFSDSWKGGVFLDANFVVVRSTAYQKILNKAVAWKGTFSELLTDLTTSKKLKAYCLNPQIVSTFSAERESKTNLYNLEESVVGYPVAETQDPETSETPETSPEIVLVTVQTENFPTCMFECLVYSYLRDKYPKDKVRWYVVTNDTTQECLQVFKGLSNVSLCSFPVSDTDTNTQPTYASVMNDLLTQMGVSDDTIIVNYPCGMYFKHDYLTTIAQARNFQVLSATETYIYTIQDGKIRKYSPVDINGHHNILSANTIAFKRGFHKARGLNSNIRNVFQEFIYGRTDVVRVLPKVCGFKIVGNTDTRLELMDIPVTAFYESEQDQSFLECIYHTY